MDRFDMTDRVIVVTGAASGIGLAFARAMIELGASVACLDRDALPLDAAVEGLGERALAVHADLADAEAVAHSVAAVLEWRGGRVDALVNNAGISCPPRRLAELPIEDWDRVIAANLRSVFLCTRGFLPTMVAGGGGAVLNMSSYLAQVGLYPGFAMTAIPYASSKAAIEGFTRQAAIEYARDGIRVNAIAPGWHGNTNLGREVRATGTPETLKLFDAYIDGCVPMGGRSSAEKLVPLMLYLCADASQYVTGQVFAHDGGLTAT